MPAFGYALPYNTGPLFKQLGTVQRTILRLALPGGSPRPKPASYHATNGRAAAAPDGAAAVPDPGPTGLDGSGPEQPTDDVRVSLPPRISHRINACPREFPYSRPPRQASAMDFDTFSVDLI